jgi:hypothetical protein
VDDNHLQVVAVVVVVVVVDVEAEIKHLSLATYDFKKIVDNSLVDVVAK